MRIPALDGVRGVAVLAVLWYHLSDYCPVNSFFAEKLKMMLRGGWCGVDLFFVLSGFLITGILLDTQNAPNYFRAFYARRVLRIFPAYYAALTLVLLVAQFTTALDAVLPPPHDRLFYFFYLNNWWVLLRGPWHANIIGHFWSLAVEEQFYLVWPLIVWRLTAKRVAAVALAGIVLAPIVRIAVFVLWGAVRDMVENPFCRMDSLLMGSLLAALLRWPRVSGSWQPVLCSTAAAAAVSIVLSNFSSLLLLRVLQSHFFIFSVLAIVFGGLILQVVMTRDARTLLQRLLGIPALTACGKYSYGMYIYHVPLLWLCARFAARLKPADHLPSFLLFAAGVTGVTFVVAKLSYDYFEIRFLMLKAKYVAV